MYIINKNLQNLHSRPLAILTELRNSNYMFFSSVNYIILYIHTGKFVVVVGPQYLRAAKS